MYSNLRVRASGLPGSAGDPITRAFIGRAMEVHSTVGPGLDEEIYHQELVSSLMAAGIPHLSKPRRELFYRGVTMSSLVIDGTCAVFVIALTDGITATDRATLQTQLRWLGLDWGIIFHFGKTTADVSFVQHSKK